MSLTELVPAAHALPRAEKLRLLQFLVNDLADEDSAMTLEAGRSYAIYTPLNQYRAAEQLQQAIDDRKKAGNRKADK